jgi:hypothetical protein
VLQLDGGILTYFEQAGGRHFDGDCFVFDQRQTLKCTLSEAGASSAPGRAADPSSMAPTPENLQLDPQVPERWPAHTTPTTGPTWPIRMRCIALLRLAPGDTVLDVGCGTGLSFEPLLERIGTLRPAGRVRAKSRHARAGCRARAAAARAGLAHRAAMRKR